MDRSQKQSFVTELNAELAGAGLVVVSQYSKLTVKQMTALRRELNANGGKLQVAKNRLAKIATEGTSHGVLNELLTGPTVLAYSADPIAAAKVAQGFADKNDGLKIIGGSMNGKFLDASGVKALSSLPSLDALRGKLIGLLQAPATKVAGVVQAPASQLARVMAAKAAA
jgi:large subunit ribosomal protein L10